jgi:hypothetical protein
MRCFGSRANEKQEATGCQSVHSQATLEQTPALLPTASRQNRAAPEWFSQRALLISGVAHVSEPTSRYEGAARRRARPLAGDRGIAGNACNTPLAGRQRSRRDTPTGGRTVSAQTRLRASKNERSDETDQRMTAVAAVFGSVCLVDHSMGRNIKSGVVHVDAPNSLPSSSIVPSNPAPHRYKRARP